MATTVELPAAAPMPTSGQVIAVPVLRGSAGDPAGRLAVRRTEGGQLACRDLDGGLEAGEWRAVEHTCSYEPAQAPALGV